MHPKGHRFDPTILREYDIRGIVGRTLTLSDALAIGRTLGTIVAAGSGRVAVVGYDGRMSSPSLEEELCRGLGDCGIYVLRIGMVPTPCLYFAAKALGASVGIMVTGSHNPAEYNGFKIMLNGLPFYGDDIKRLKDLAARGVWVHGHGGVVEADSMKAYLGRVLRDYRSTRGLRVGWDPGNGVAGPATLGIAGALPGEHYVINEKVDGTFPAHHPDPTVAKNLEQLQELVLAEKLDMGVAFDGDGDRIGVVDDKAEIIWGDQLLAILAAEVLKTMPGAPILADVKASDTLFDEIERLGGQPVMCPTGHSIIKSKMADLNSPLAGEMSGHIFMADRYFGFDDALYAAVRLINLVASGRKRLSELREALPSAVNTPEIRIDVDEDRKFEIVDEIRDKLRAEGATVNAVDGARVKEEDGWWLLRASNTQPALVARCEAKDEHSLSRIKGRLVEILRGRGIDPSKIPDLSS